MTRLTLFICLLFFLSCNVEEKQEQKRENDEIEIVSFPELQAMLDQKDDKVRVVNFWATWCKPCVEELPLFEEIQDSLGVKNLEVLLISLDFPDKLESQLIPFVQKHQIKPQVILLDDPHENEWIPKVDSTWSGAIPATLILKGSRREFFEKSFTRTSLNKEISKFIKT